MKAANYCKNLVAILAISALVIACHENGSMDSLVSDSQKINLQGAGSTFVSPLMWRWIEQYDSSHSDVSVTYSAVGSGEGINRFVNGSVDFGASDSAMNDAEIARMQPPAGRGVKLIPVAAGEVVVAYNIEGLNGILALPRDVYSDIFLGRITYWNDARIVAANPGLKLPARQIQVIARKDSSGTTFAFTNHLSSISDLWRKGPGAAKLIDWPGRTIVTSGNEGVAQKLKISKYSIGYVEYGFAKRLGISMAALENRAGKFVTPGAESGESALASAVADIPDNLRLFLPDPDGLSAYPIVSLVWLLLPQINTDFRKKDALTGLVDWFLTVGQPNSTEMGYIPLPENLISLARKSLMEN
jgi:phosphate transport system substrate-binding protein